MSTKARSILTRVFYNRLSINRKKRSKEKLAEIGCITVIQISLFIISIDLVKTAGQVLKL